MKKKPVVKKEKEQNNINVPGLIIAIILLIAILIGGFFLGRWFISRTTTKEDDTTEKEDGKEYTDRLLKLLNDNINKTKMGEETLANEVTSFSYKEKNFYISGYNGSTVYQYKVDLSSISLSTTIDALDYLKEHDVEGSYDITLNRCTPYESNEFTTKYVSEGVTGKYHIGTFGSEQYAYATLLKGEQITVINGDTLTDTLSSTYTPTTINNSDPLYSVYKYIAIK